MSRFPLERVPNYAVFCTHVHLLRIAEQSHNSYYVYLFGLARHRRTIMRAESDLTTIYATLQAQD